MQRIPAEEKTRNYQIQIRWLKNKLPAPFPDRFLSTEHILLFTCSALYVLKNIDARKKCSCRRPIGLFLPIVSQSVTQTHSVIPKNARKRRFSIKFPLAPAFPKIGRAGRMNSYSLVLDWAEMKVPWYTSYREWTYYRIQTQNLEITLYMPP